MFRASTLLILPSLLGYLLLVKAPPPQIEQLAVFSYVILITFSLPHFTLSLMRSNFNWKVEKVKKGELVIASCLILLIVSLLLLKNNPYKNLIFVIFSIYQTWHYSMQNYGISKFFQTHKHVQSFLPKYFYLFVGLFFLKNTSIAYLKIINDQLLLSFIKNFSQPNILHELIFLCLVYFLLLIWSRNQNKNIPIFSHLINILWITWATLSSLSMFFLYLPALHSLQYLFFLKINKDKLKMAFIITVSLSLISTLYFFLNQSYPKFFTIEYATVFILSLNILHILSDSIGWKNA
jgi:hypothetical protein